MICKVKKKGMRVKATCKVRYAASASSSKVRWRIMQGGKARSHGRTNLSRLQRIIGALPSGRYVLRVPGQRGTRIAIG